VGGVTRALARADLLPHRPAVDRPAPRGAPRGRDLVRARSRSAGRGGTEVLCGGTHGFLAHTARGLIYIKSFTDVPPELRAPGEAEIEIYANNRYVEVEVQGPYSVIDPGESVSWTVRWYLRKLPPDIVPFPGNAELLSFAAGVVRPSSSAKAAQLTRPTPHSLDDLTKEERAVLRDSLLGGVVDQVMPKRCV